MEDWPDDPDEWREACDDETLSYEGETDPDGGTVWMPEYR
jgi:hypothetical protein